MVSETEKLKRTALYDLHIANDARMVPFAGYEMPVQYAGGIKKEHLHCRTQAGLFDISHMGQVKLCGEGVAAALEKLVPGDIQTLPMHAQRYSVFTNNQGGIIDDLMITNAGDYLFLVINAACKESDIQYMQGQLAAECDLQEMENQSLLALQGPKAASVLQAVCPEATQLVYMSGKEFVVNDIPCFINRCGYTGEDGFEISMPSVHAEMIAKLFLANKQVELIGLGARDLLRLEAGYCLYGHDLNENTTPVEANLNWLLSKTRLQDPGSSYPGIEIIRKQLNEGVTRLRVGIVSEGRVPLREGMDVLTEKEEAIGRITSGGFSPNLEKPIAMAYIEKEAAEMRRKLLVNIRGRIQKVEVVYLPFVQHKYFKN